MSNAMKMVAVLLGSAMLLAAGCQDEEQQGEEIRIGLIAKSSNNPVFLAARAGAEARAAELSKEHGMNIVIDWQTPPTENAEEQANRINQLAASGADAIIVSASGAEAITPAIDSAVAQGVPVMMFDSDAPNSDRFAFYGVNDLQTGQNVIDALVGVIGDQGDVAILAGNQNAPNLQERVRGIRERVAAQYPNIRIVDVFYHVETPEDATDAVRRAMEANPQINGWAMVGGWPLFSDALVQDFKNRWPNVKIVAVDALPAQLVYVEQGVAPVLLAQKVYDWGYQSVDLTFRKLQGEDVPEINIMELVPVTPESLGEWAHQLQDWGFEDVPQRYLEMGAAGEGAATQAATAPATADGN